MDSLKSLVSSTSTLRFPAALIVSALLLTACPKKTESTGTIDPCSLLTREEVEQASGGTVAEPKPGILAERECAYTATQGTNSIRFELDVQRDTTREDFDQAHADGSIYRPTSGLGDAAYWSTGTRGGSIAVLTGSTQLSLSFVPSEGAAGDPNELRGDMEALVKKALDRYRAASG